MAMKFYERILSGELFGKQLVEELGQQFAYHLQFEALERAGPSSGLKFSEIFDVVGKNFREDFEYQNLEMSDHPYFLLATLERIINENCSGACDLAVRILVYDYFIQKIVEFSKDGVFKYNKLVERAQQGSPDLAHQFGLEKLDEPEPYDFGVEPGGPMGPIPS